jgi:hypothetical protein
MKINLTRDQILQFADRYDFGQDHDISGTMQAAAARGHMTRDDLIVVAKWKWKGGRTRQLCRQNSEPDVEEITRVSFSTSSERLRIGALLALRGVHWPMASVILHFAFPTKYPILDVRAMGSVGASTIYTFEKWLEYCALCRQCTLDHGVSMRTLDKALWAFDKLGDGANLE